MSDGPHEIAPCPWCQSETPWPRPELSMWSVTCKSCLARGRWCSTKAEAITAWNRVARLSTPQPQCGHPHACIYTGGEGTSHCTVCAETSRLDQSVKQASAQAGEAMNEADRLREQLARVVAMFGDMELPCYCPRIGVVPGDNGMGHEVHRSGCLWGMRAKALSQIGDKE